MKFIHIIYIIGPWRLFIVCYDADQNLCLVIGRTCSDGIRAILGFVGEVGAGLASISDYTINKATDDRSEIY
jgi:hypothetical protein